ncbi:MAG: cupin domain-containing protein [Proteobacteria bacterium]|nr:cupin domain-containing protein [Pseudomonadota bacterium]
MPSRPLPYRIDTAPDPVDRELEPLLGEPIAKACADFGSDTAIGPLRTRLLHRVAESAAASRRMFTARPQRMAAEQLAPGVFARTLYETRADHAPRPGEPVRARLIEVHARTRWAMPGDGLDREWLVLKGAARLDGERMELRDYHLAPGTGAGAVLESDEGATLFLRECRLPDGGGGKPLTVRDEEAGWPEFAPGIHRRVLWQHAGQAAMLYCAQAGACLPLHSHGRDEECLMLQGELFLDDLLLREGDYQLAPAGTSHHTTATDTGVVIYAHGDLDLQITPAPA